MKTYIVDIDDTLLISEKKECQWCDRIEYTLIDKIDKEIDKLKKLFNSGNTVILWTGRGWDCYEITKKQLKEAGIPYHELIMGKPQGIYVDKDALTTLENEID